MAVLSAEVMCEILDLVVPPYDTRYSAGERPSYAELKQLSLVCRAWATYIQYRLFDHVDLSSFDSRLAFLRAVGRNTSRSHGLKRTTRTLVLSGPIFRPGGPRDVLDVLSPLSSLENVHLRKGFTLPYIPSSRYLPKGFPAIQSFDIEMNRSSSWETLHDLLHKLPTLERLAIRDPSASSFLPSISGSPLAFHLKEFLFLCPWRCVDPDYLNAMLHGSSETLEVLGLSMMSTSEPAIGELLTKHSQTLRSLGLDTAEPTILDPSILQSLGRLEQLVLTTSDPELIPFLPPALKRLQFNTPIFTHGRPLVDRFAETLQVRLESLRALEELFMAGRHHTDDGNRLGQLLADVQLGRAEVERYAALGKECEKWGVRLRTAEDSDDTAWTRFYDHSPMRPASTQ